MARRPQPSTSARHRYSGARARCTKGAIDRNDQSMGAGCRRPLAVADDRSSATGSQHLAGCAAGAVVLARGFRSPPAGVAASGFTGPIILSPAAGPDQVKPTFKTKWPSLRLSTPPPTQCTRNASRMMARITTTTQKKNTMMPGMAYPATVLALATATSYPPAPDLFGGCLPETTTVGVKARRGSWGVPLPMPGGLRRQPNSGRNELITICWLVVASAGLYRAWTGRCWPPRSGLAVPIR